VAARLEPAAELAVVHEQKRPASRPADDSAAGDVALGVPAPERVGRQREKPEHPEKRGFFPGILRGMVREERDELSGLDHFLRTWKRLL
jgi:hypothetical protein